MALDFFVRIIGKDQTGPAVSSAKKNFDRLRDARGRFVGGAGGGGGGRKGRGFFGRGVGADLTIAAQGIDELSRKSRAAALAPLTAYMDVEAQLDAVEARLAGPPEKIAAGMEKIKARALQVGKDVKGATSLQAAGAAEFLAQAGWSPEQIDASLVPIAKFSKAMRTDLDTTADIVSDVAGQFQIPADEVAGNLGRMTRGINMANMDLRTFFEAAKFGGPVMKALGNDLSDTTAIFGALANVGIKGSLGGTTVKSLTRVLDPRGDKGKAAARRLGVSRRQLKKKGIEKDGRIDVPLLFQEIARTVDKKGMGGTDALRNLKDLFGLEPLAGTASLLALEMQALGKNIPAEIAKAAEEGGAKTQGAKSLTQLSAEIRKADVTDLEAAYDKATGNLKSDVEGLSAELQEFSREVGEAWAPAVKELLPGIKENVIGLADWAKNNKDLVISIGKVLGVIAVSGPVITPVVLGLTAVKTVLSLIGGTSGVAMKAAKALGGEKGLAVGVTRLGAVATTAAIGIWAAVRAFEAWEAKKEHRAAAARIGTTEAASSSFQKNELRSTVRGLSDEQLLKQLADTKGQVIGATREGGPKDAMGYFLANIGLGTSASVVNTGRAREEALLELADRASEGRGQITDAQRAELLVGAAQRRLAERGITDQERVEATAARVLKMFKIDVDMHVTKDGRVIIDASSTDANVTTTQQLDTGVVAGS